MVTGGLVYSVTAGFVRFGDKESKTFQNAKGGADLVQYGFLAKSLAKLGIGGGAAIWGIIKASAKTPDDVAKLAYAVTQNAKIGDCVQCANALETVFKAKGVAGEVIQLRTESRAAIEIVSDTAGAGRAISDNGIHQAVRVGEMVFDNIHKNGIKYADWIKDFHSRDKLVTEVLRSF